MRTSYSRVNTSFIGSLRISSVKRYTKTTAPANRNQTINLLCSSEYRNRKRFFPQPVRHKATYAWAHFCVRPGIYDVRRSRKKYSLLSHNLPKVAVLLFLLFWHYKQRGNQLNQAQHYFRHYINHGTEVDPERTNVIRASQFNLALRLSRKRGRYIKRLRRGR